MHPHEDAVDNAESLGMIGGDSMYACRRTRLPGDEEMDCMTSVRAAWMSMVLTGKEGLDVLIRQAVRLSFGVSIEWWWPGSITKVNHLRTA